MKRQFLPFLVSAMVAAGPALAAGQAWAQSAPAQAAPVPQGSEEVRYSSEELKTYAVAALEVQKLNQAYMSQLPAAESEQAKQALRKNTMDQMVEAVKDSGMSLEKYNRITVESGDNLALSRKIAEEIRQIQ